MLTRARTFVLNSTNPDKSNQKVIENPEYVHLCSDLKITNNALNALHKRMKDNERHWRDLCDKQKGFADGFAKLFYENAELRHVGVRFQETASAIDAEMRAHFVDAQDVPHRALKSRVVARIAAIDAVLARRGELRKMARARARAHRALKKARAAHPALEPPSEQLAEKERTYADADKLYTETLAAVMDVMKTLLADAHYTYACAFSEFCWVSTHASGIVEYSMRKMKPVADDAVKKLLASNGEKYVEQMDAADTHSSVSLN